jgi:hypothetical protein
LDYALGWVRATAFDRLPMRVVKYVELHRKLAQPCYLTWSDPSICFLLFSLIWPKSRQAIYFRFDETAKE